MDDDSLFTLPWLLLDDLPDRVWAKNLDGRYIFVNKAYVKLLGSQAKERIGFTDNDIYPPDIAVLYRAADLAVIESRTPLKSEDKLTQAAHGVNAYFETIKIPFFDKTGAVAGVYGVSRDITLRKSYEERIASQNWLFSVLHEVSLELIAQHDTGSLLQKLLQRSAEVIEAPLGFIMTIDAAGTVMHTTHVWGITSNANVGSRPLKLGQSFLGQVWEQGRSLVVNDYQYWPDRISHPSFANASALVGIPIKTVKDTLGVLALCHTDFRRQFSETDVSTLEQFSTLAAVSLSNLRLLETITFEVAQRRETEKKRRKIFRETVSDIVRRANRQDVLQAIVFRATLLVNAPVGYCCVLEPNDSEPLVAATIGFEADLLNGTAFWNTGVAGMAWKSGKALVDNDCRSQEGALQCTPFERIAAVVALPLKNSLGEVTGLLTLLHFDEALRFQEEDVVYLEELAHLASLAIDNSRLYATAQLEISSRAAAESDLRRAYEKLDETYDTTLEGWTRAIDLRDRETEGHSRRVAYLTKILARTLGVPEKQLTHIWRGALLHDIGKLGVPDAVLLKPHGLTEAEWELMRLHPIYGYEWLLKIEYLRPTLAIPRSHHEKWDGSGYPDGLKGEDIPLEARIFAPVDVWDALSSNRPYRECWPEDKIRAHIQSLSGTHFDPAIVEAFLALPRDIFIQLNMDFRADRT